MYSLSSKWTILPGHENQVTGALKALAIEVQKEAGTLLYLVHVPSHDQLGPINPPPGEVTFWEVYKDQKAFYDHVNGQTFIKFVDAYGHLFVQDNGSPSKPLMVTEILTQIGGFVRPVNS